MIEIHSEYPEFENVQFVFRDRGTILPGDRRPLWRVSLIVALLQFASRGATSSLPRLHVLDWAVRSQAGRDQILAHISGQRLQTFTPVRFDPALLRALHFSLADKIIVPKGDNVTLGTRGEAIAADLSKNTDLLRPERAFLEAIGKKFTEKAATAFIKIGAQYDYAD